MQRLTFSEGKSVELHISKKKYKKRCPELKVHKSIIKRVDTVRYLGDVVSASGSMWPCVEDRRDKEWGKVAEITGNGILFKSGGSQGSDWWTQGEWTLSAPRLSTT